MDILEQSDEYIDVTDIIEVYNRGKVLSCPNCDQDIGVEHNVESVKCAGCNKILVDQEYEDREDQYEEEKQGGLDDWM